MFDWGEKGNDGKWGMKNINFLLFDWSETLQKIGCIVAFVKHH